MRIGVVIPALNEARSVGEDITRCFAQGEASDQMRIVVCDNGSCDGTAGVARQHGAEIVHEGRLGPRKWKGCLRQFGQRKPMWFSGNVALFREA